MPEFGFGNAIFDPNAVDDHNNFNLFHNINNNDTNNRIERYKESIQDRKPPLYRVCVLWMSELEPYNVAMVLDFDVKIFCQNLKATKPPYECPVKNCGKIYKSYCGIQFHLYNFDHENPENNVPSPAKKPGKKKKGWHHRQMRRSPTPPEFLRPNQKTLSYAESQRLVEIDLGGQLHRINIYEPLEIISQDEIDNHHNTEKEEKAEKTPIKAKVTDVPKVRKEQNTPAHGAQTKLPEAMFKVVEDYIKPSHVKEKQNSYYRYIEKSTDQLDDEVEYDMDEEDHAWLEIINEKRREETLPEVSQEDFELLMDRFEKEAFFQSQTSGKDPTPSIDEEAVCTICLDGECQNSNQILFCDMCNLAVHQECYGVPYIPEGQWLCRRCLQSPSRAVDCCLCPNKGGAFKQTDDGHWAHVVCSLWIPEVGFANTVFLEPIDSIEHIPSARWKLTCYICKQRGTGACIQCHKTNCYVAFHVTCAQQAGLHMKIEPFKETSATGTNLSVRKTSYCDVHTPANSECTPMLGDSDDDMSIDAKKKAKEKSRIKMRKARKILAEKRNAMPVVSIPIIPAQRLSKITDIVTLSKKQQFLSRLMSYWTLKRQSRNGVPLLRRLQSSHMTRNKDQTKNDKQSNALREQLKYWQRLRQDLEKARLLVELIRKREKLKQEQMRIHQLATEMELQPFVILLRNSLDQLEERDTGNIFTEPVSLEEVPDYLEYIDQPMDFSTMRKKVDGHCYQSLNAFERDFELMVTNCMKYNAKDTVFYRAAVKLRDQGGSVIRATRRMIERVGYDMDTGLHTKDLPNLDQQPLILEDIDSFFEMKDGLSLGEQLHILLDKMDMANNLKKGKVRKTKLCKRLKREILRVRRRLAIQRGNSLSDGDENMSMESELSEDDVMTPASLSPARRSSARHSLDKPVFKSEVTPTGSHRGRGRGRPRLQSRSESEFERTPGRHSRNQDDCKKTSDSPRSPRHSSSHAPQDDKNLGSSTPSTSGVNRRTAVLFSKKAHKTSSTPNTPGNLSRRPGRPPKSRASIDYCDSPQPPVLEPMTTLTSCRQTSPANRKRSSGSAGYERDNHPSPPKRAASLTEPLQSFSEPPDLTKRDSFLVYRGMENNRSSSESDSTSVMSSSDESLSDSSSGSSSSRSRSEHSTNGLPKIDEDETESIGSSSSNSNPLRRSASLYCGDGRDPGRLHVPAPTLLPSLANSQTRSQGFTIHQNCREIFDVTQECMSGDNDIYDRSLDSGREMCSKNVLHSDFQSVVGKSEDKGVRRQKLQSPKKQNSVKQRKESKKKESRKKRRNIEVPDTEKRGAGGDSNIEMMKTRISKRKLKTNGDKKLSSAEVYNAIRAIVAPDGQEICTARIVKSPTSIPSTKEKVNKEVKKGTGENVCEGVDYDNTENQSFLEAVEDKGNRRQSIRRQNYFEGILLQKLSPAEVYNQIRGIVAPKGEEICLIKRQIKSVSSQKPRAQVQEKNIPTIKCIEQSKNKSIEQNGIQKLTQVENSEKRLSRRLSSQNHPKASQGSLYNQILQILSPEIENNTPVRKPKTTIEHKSSENSSEITVKQNKSVVQTRTSVMSSVGNRIPSSESPGAIYRQIRGIVAPGGTEILIPPKKQTTTITKTPPQSPRPLSKELCVRVSRIKTAEETRTNSRHSNLATKDNCVVGVTRSGRTCSRETSFQSGAVKSNTTSRSLRSGKLCKDTYARPVPGSGSVLPAVRPGPCLAVADIEMGQCTRSGNRRQHSNTGEQRLETSLGVASGGRAGTRSTEKLHDSLGRACRSTSSDSDDAIPLEPLDLIWAKCRGYPWYPALIINPKMPRTGYFHNGVPIPVPPEDVLQLQKRYDEQVYLVLFFDTKRTWQWLPRSKLEPLGVDSALDKSKLLESKKQNVRKAVQIAYEKAILHRCSVTGEPNPLSGDSSNED
ncbi:hypothetical protein ScPMuIL_009706 [Solemya velum]